ncbi:MAG: ABC transporter ATP-binding protein [Acidimicrobiia bacterium]
MSREAVIQVRRLVKHYEAVRAVDGIDLSIHEGEVFALLGPNGAGKTTTVEILEGHRRRATGEVRVLGFDPQTGGRPFRERIGIVLQSSGFERELSVREVLGVYRPMYPRPRSVEEVIELVGLGAKADTRVKALSGGQQRRLDLALGLIGDPDLLFLDEPTTGFDPSARRRAWELVDDLRSLGKTILLTTHYMDEAQHLADRVAVMAGGQIVAEGTPASLVGGETATQISFRLPAGTSVGELPRLEGEVEVHGESVQLSTRRATQTLHALTSWATERGVELEGLTVLRPSLEEVYLELTGREGDG